VPRLEFRGRICVDPRFDSCAAMPPPSPGVVRSTVSGDSSKEMPRPPCSTMSPQVLSGSDPMSMELMRSIAVARILR
jgi:hypothetical protein